MKKILLLCLLMAMLSSDRALAGEMGDQFLKARHLYSEGKYQESVTLYESILNSGVSSGPLYYNLGNAYFKLNQPGRALLNYERARRLMPQDEDLLANLSFVRSLLEQAQPTEELRWMEQAASAILNRFSETGWAIVLVVIWNLLFVFLLLAVFAARIRRTAVRLAWLVGAAAVFCGGFAFTKIDMAQRIHEAIVVQKEVEVRYSPSLMGAVAFQLHEGIKTQVIRCEGHWCYIRLTRDKSGWVEQGTLEVI